MSTVSVRPQNSILFLGDATAKGVLPDIVRSRTVWATSSCIAFGCTMEFDGPTLVTLTTVRPDPDLLILAFDGTLLTPSLGVVLLNVGGETVLECEVSTKETGVQIWMDRRREPREVVILLQQKR